MTVYLMRSVKTGLYKIGYTNRATQLRLDELRAHEGTIGGNDPTIELDTQWRGSKRLERFLHNRHKPYRVKGEWFRLTSQHIEILYSFMMLVHTVAIDEREWNRLYLRKVEEI